MPWHHLAVQALSLTLAFASPWVPIHAHAGSPPLADEAAPPPAPADEAAPAPADEAAPPIPEPEPTPPPSTQPAAVASPTQLPATWSGGLAIRRCSDTTLELPAQTERALDATLLVRTADSIGSAVVISPDGFALTAAHVVDGAATVSVVDHSGATRTATVVRVDEVQDVALLKLQVMGDAPCLGLAPERLPIGTDVFVLGSPAGEQLSFSVAKGIVSGYRDMDGSHFVQLDAAVNPGNSGGPVVSAAGLVVGIASWKVAEVSMEGLSFAVPCDTLLVALEIDLSDASEANWSALGGRRNREAGVPGMAAGAVPSAAAYGPTDPTLVRRRKVKTGFIVSGAVLLAVGGGTVAATGVAYYLSTEMSTATWQGLQAGNTMGWALVGVGAAALITGVVIPKKKKSRGPAEPQVSVVPTLGGAVLRGSF